MLPNIEPPATICIMLAQAIEHLPPVAASSLPQIHAVNTRLLSQILAATAKTLAYSLGSMPPRTRAAHAAWNHRSPSSIPWSRPAADTHLVPSDPHIQGRHQRLGTLIPDA
jgi:hypothetical protein